MSINHNLSAINTHRVLIFQHWSFDLATNLLSSDMRINKSADDASGLAVSDKMRSQINGLRQAARNAEDGISLIQTPEWFLEESKTIIQKIRVFAVKSSRRTITLSTAHDSNMIIGVCDNAIHLISKQRADLDACFNRLERTAKGLLNIYENMQSSEKCICDADMAETTVCYKKNLIFFQSKTSLLAQANNKSQVFMQLLR